MTVLVGVLAGDGAVVGADTGMSTTDLKGDRVVEHPTTKLLVAHDGVLVLALTGETGAHGRIHESIKKHYHDGLADPKIRGLDDHEYAKWLYQPVRNAAVTDDAYLNYVVGRLKAGKDGASVEYATSFLVTSIRQRIGAGFSLHPRHGRALLSYYEGTDVVEVLRENVPFSFKGSGQRESEIFFHFLRSVLFPKGGLPSVAQASLAVYWSIQHCIDTNTGGVSGEPHLAVLKHGEARAEILPPERLEEHRRMVDELRARIVAQVDDVMTGRGPVGGPVVGKPMGGQMPSAASTSKPE